jgi:hypothetical protein
LEEGEMEVTLSNLQKLKENLELAAFLVSKGGSEREAHGKIVESLVIVSQFETHIKNESSHSSLEEESFYVSSSESRYENINLINTGKEIALEVEKVTRKLPRWFRNPSQYNSTILCNYLKLYAKNQKVAVQTLRNECSSISDFDGNYNQMKNFGEKNHGKVFEERDGYVTLWEPVKDYILKLYNENIV